MTIERGRILVVDIEATCWDTAPPPGQNSEIIEIGLCIYDLNKDVIFGRHSIWVKPVTSVISPFCTQLTAITPQQIDEAGIDFAAACQILVDEYQARKLLWTSWGAYDLKLFRRQCRRMGLSYPFGKKHLNLRRAFADYQGERMGLARALRQTQIGLVGQLHRGADDAWNSARLLQHLVHQQGLGFIQRHW